MQPARPTPSGKRPDFFSFSRSQRRAVLLLSLLVALVGSTRYYFWQKEKIETPEDPALVLAALDELAMADTARQHSNYYPRRSTEYRNSNRTYLPRGSSAPPGRLFRFDPNTITEAELQTLGLRPQVAQAWVRYRERGGQFRQPEDIRKLRLLSAADAERLIPWVQLPTQPPALAASPAATTTAAPESTSAPAGKKARAPLRIDLNTADSSALLALPGIGEKRAAALVKYRNRLGGFVSMDQLAEVRALPDSVVQQIAPYLSLDPAAIVPLPLNTASEDALALHPYIGRRYAKIIVAYRQQHGPFARIDDLLKIHILNETWLAPLRPYLSLD